MSEITDLNASIKTLTNLMTKNGGGTSNNTTVQPTSWIGAITEGVKKGWTGPLDVMKDLYSKSLAQRGQYSPDESLGGEDVIKAVRDFSPLEAVKKIYGQILNQVQNEANLRVKINEETGMTGKLSEQVRDSILSAYPGVIQLGYGMEQLTDFYTTMIEKSGRFNILNKDSLIRTAEVSRAFVGDLKQMAEYMNNFMNIGLGASDAADEIEKAGVKSLSLGLRAKTTVTDINKNIEQLNAYGFKNGIQGLADMSRKATEFRMTMDGVFKVADKVWSPEGAIDLSANLQVIGGILGDFNDPLKLMYMATNNVEGLQKAMIDAAGSLATYNDAQGRFEVTGINLRKAKAMADELGMSVQELSKGAVAAAERGQAMSAIFSTGIQMKDDDREFLTNLSQMEGGEMVIKIPESIADKIGAPMTIPLNQMSNTIAQRLLDNKKELEKQDSRSIAMDQLMLTEKIERNIVSIAASAKLSLSNAVKNNLKTMDANVKLQTLSGLTGKSAEELTRSGGKDLEGFIDKTLMSLRDTFTKGSITDVMESNRKITDSLKKREDEDTAKRKKDVEIKHIHEYNASPSLLDNLGRFIARSPQTWEDIYSGHHENPGSFTYTEGGF